MKIKALIVDDEQNSREVLSNLLTNCASKVEIVGFASNVDEAFQKCNLLNPELVFLDIQMPRSNGFNLLKKFKEIPFETIFVTSFDQYAINAIKFNALDYLLKPVEINELLDSIERARINIQKKKNKSELYINLLHNIETNNHSKKFAIHIGENVKMLNSSDIIYIEADGRYSIIYMNTNEIFTTPKNLKDFEYFFGSKSNFIRINKSLLINSDFIKEYHKGEPFMIKMTNERIFEASRRKKSEVLEKIAIVK